MYTNGSVKVEIKISATSCLGKREWKVSEKGINGCLPIINMYQIGHYNLFVRCKPSHRLDDIIVEEDVETIDPRKCVSDLARILRNMHDMKMFVRFIVPKNIIFFNNQSDQLEVMFEEFNTIKFEDNASSDFSEQTSSSNDESLRLESKEIKAINTGKIYTIDDEIKSLAYVINQLSCMNRDLNDLRDLSDAVERCVYSLMEIELHPIVQTTEKYYGYLDTLASWISKTKSNKDRFKKACKKTGTTVQRVSVFCEKVINFYNENCTLADWDSNLSFVKAQSPASFIITMSHIHKHSHTVYLNSKWHSNQRSRETFLKRLRKESAATIETIHRAVLKMDVVESEIRTALCIPEKGKRM